MENVKLTVICVDDDTFMLKAISRVLRRLRTDWNVYVYDDPVSWHDQWQLEQEEHIDIFISDLIMPKKRGDELLEEIRQSNPQAIRVLLTGDMTGDLPTIAHKYAHFVIPKPFGQEDFEHLFECAERLHRMPFTQDCRHKLGKFSGLPVLPTCISELKEALKDPDCDSQRIADVISHEPALVAKLLQIANSPYFGFKRNTDSLTEVVARVGSSLIESVAISMLLNVPSDNLTKQQHQNIANLSLKIASIARLIAKLFGRSLAEQDKVFIAALLTSVGSLMMLAIGAKEAQVKQYLQFQNGLFDNHVVAAYILIMWGYDLQIGEIILNQKSISFVDVSDTTYLAAIVGLAGKIAQCTSEEDFKTILKHIPDSLAKLLIEQQSVLLDL